MHMWGWPILIPSQCLPQDESQAGAAGASLPPAALLPSGSLLQALSLAHPLAAPPAFWLVEREGQGAVCPSQGL